MMSSLGEKIARITNPSPLLILDPEDAINTDSAAKICDDDSLQHEENEVSDLRRKTAPLLEDVDPTYAGKKISRRDLGHIFQEDGKVDANIISSDVESDDKSYSECSEDDDLSDDEIKKFKKLVASKSKESEDEDEDEEENEDEEDEEIGSDEESSGVDDDEKNESDEMTKQFSNIDVTSEIERAQAIKNQKEIWNRLLESRIKLQKLLLVVNRLPQFPSFEKLSEKGGEELIESSKKASQSVKQMMKIWIDLQTELTNRNIEITNSTNNRISKKVDDGDEEIPSDTDDEMEVSNQPDELEKKGNKRKIMKEDCETVLEKRFKSIIPYRNATIQKWDDKTRLAIGKTQKSFTAFDNSALKQIEQNLQDKVRLVRRTQLKRSLYRVLGKPESELKNSENLEEETSVSKQDMLLKDYDPEIFDDDDFYRQILKDVIESKSFGVDAAAIRKQMDIQKIRNKMKRKVDTKASKGRKLRYEVHPKLVNFLAQVQSNEMPEEARDSFIKCIFAGMNSSQS